MKGRRILVKRVYGDDNRHDQFLGGLFKSKHKKKKEKLELQQKDASLNLTLKQSQIADAKAKAETYKAQAEQMRAIAAQKQAEKADTQLKGARATTQLKYVGLGIGALIVVGGVVLTVYMIKQGKRSALIRAKIAKVKAAGSMKNPVKTQ